MFPTLIWFKLYVARPPVQHISKGSCGHHEIILWPLALLTLEITCGWELQVNFPSWRNSGHRWVGTCWNHGPRQAVHVADFWLGAETWNGREIGTWEPDQEGSIRNYDDTTLHKATGLLFMAYNSYDLIFDDPIIRFTIVRIRFRVYDGLRHWPMKSWLTPQRDISPLDSAGNIVPFCCAMISRGGKRVLKVPIAKSRSSE